MAVIEISSDFGLRWGNRVVTPTELAEAIDGIDVVDGLLVFDGVKVVNHENREYIVDQLGFRHDLLEIVERIHSESLH